MRESLRFGEEFVSDECGRSDHSSCSHLSGVGAGLKLSPTGFGFRPLLCHCECHANCSLSTDGHHTVDEWFDSCNCPGAESARERAGRPPDVAELMRKARDEANLRREAIEEARARSTGKSREEVREILIAELQTRGLQPPPPSAMELELDGIMEHGILGRVRLAGRGIATFIGIGNTIKDFRRHLQAEDTDLTLSNAPILVDPDRSLPSVEVQVDPDAEHLLDPTSDHEKIEHADDDIVLVRLKAVGSPIIGGLIAIFLGNHRVGVLSLADSAAYRALLEASTRSNQPLLAEAVRRRSPDGTWHLYLFQPRA
jgi:hypothetical protein